MKKSVLAIVIVMCMAGVKWGIDTVPLPESTVKKVAPSKVNLKKSGEKINVIVRGINLHKVSRISIGKYQGKKFVNSMVTAVIDKKKSSSRYLAMTLHAGKNARIGKDFIIRLHEKWKDRKYIYREIPTKQFSLSVTPSFQKMVDPMEKPKLEFPRPDLGVKITAPEIATVNQDFIVRFDVFNYGQAPSKATELKFQVTIDYITVTTKIVHIPRLNRFQWKTISHTIRVPVGEQIRIYAVVDRKDKMGDTNRKNNQAEKYIEINDPTPKFPDLIVCVSIDKSEGIGKTVTVLYSVRNIGDAASKKCKLRTKASNINLPGIGHLEQIPSLDPWKTHTITYEYNWIVPQKIQFTAKIDALLEVQESNEKNNKASKIVRIASPVVDVGFCSTEK